MQRRNLPPLRDRIVNGIRAFRSCICPGKH
jgi:hypothetical protein